MSDDFGQYQTVRSPLLSPKQRQSQQQVSPSHASIKSAQIESPKISERKNLRNVPVTTPKQSIAITEQLRHVDEDYTDNNSTRF